SEIGAAAVRMAAGTASSDGIQTINPEQGVQAFEAALRWAPPQIGVLYVDWPEFFRKFSAVRTSPLLVQFAEKKERSFDTPLAAERADFIEQLEKTIASERRNLIHEQIRNRAAKVLGVAAQSIDLTRPLHELGLDSLMAIELRNTLGVMAGKSLPTTLLF